MRELAEPWLMWREFASIHQLMSVLGEQADGLAGLTPAEVALVTL